MHCPKHNRRLVARAACLCAIVCSLRTAAPASALPAANGVVAAYAVGSVEYHAWINGQVTTPAPTRAFPSGTATVAYYVSYRDAVPAGSSPESRLYDARGVLLQSNIALFGTVCKQHACMDSFSSKPAFADGSYRIEVLLPGAAAASIPFTVGRAAPVAMGNYRVLAFYTTTTAASNASDATHRDPAPAATFPNGTAAIGYWIAVKGRVARTRYQIVLSLPGAGIVYRSTPSGLVAAEVRLGTDEVYTASVSDTLTIHPAFPAGVSRLDLLLDGKEAATTTFTIAAR